MDNWYEEIITEIRQLIEQKQYEQASALVTKELSMPYIPSDIEKQLQQLQKDIRYGKSENRVVQESSLDQILMDLYGDASRQLAAVNALMGRNLRQLTDEIQAYFNSDPFPQAQALLINAIASQQIEEEFTVIKDGLEYTFDGDCVVPVDQCEGFVTARQYMQEWLGNKYPSVYELAMKVLVSAIYMNLPLTYEKEEGRDLAYECACQVADLLQDEVLQEQLKQYASDNNHVILN